jgi:hypothetical protein
VRTSNSLSPSRSPPPSIDGRDLSPVTSEIESAMLELRFRSDAPKDRLTSDGEDDAIKQLVELLVGEVGGRFADSCV